MHQFMPNITTNHADLTVRRNKKGIELKGYVFCLLETTAMNVCQLNFKLAVIKAKRLTAGLTNSLQQLLRFFLVPDHCEFCDEQSRTIRAFA